MCLSSTDQRRLAIIKWLRVQLGFDIQQFEPASNDASFRRYFRVVHTEGKHIVMDAPPDKENTEPFIRNAELLRKADVHVPMIYQTNLTDGFLLLEDFGTCSFLDQLNDETVNTLYRSALNCLFRLQTHSGLVNGLLPAYDTALLQRELDLFSEWFLRQLLSQEMPTAIKKPVDTLLIGSALAQPFVCVHRDFHSRNLMVLPERSPGVIDFQDAVIGPITYDLVSLLRDCYIQWPQNQVEQWVTQYHQRLVNAGQLDADLETFLRWFDLMGLQRHLKAIGIFARLHLRDQKSAYLADIPRTMSYVMSVCRNYPELSEFFHFIQAQVIPIYRDRL